MKPMLQSDNKNYLPFYKCGTDDFRRVRPHLSWSQFYCYLRGGPREYIMRYFYNDNRENAAMQLGKRVAEMLENDVEQEDIVMDSMRILLPQYQFREHKLEANLNGIPLLGFLDGFNMIPVEIGEYKTGRQPWTQREVDKAIGGRGAQLTMYSLQLMLKDKIKPETVPIKLIWMPTEWNDGDPKLTGEMKIFPTRRTTLDCLRLGAQITKVWHDIGECCEAEFKATGQ